MRLMKVTFNFNYGRDVQECISYYVVFNVGHAVPE